MKRTVGIRFKILSGISLVETIISIGIICVLVMLVMAYLKKAMDSAHAAACTANLNKLGHGIIDYACDHGGIVPPSQNFVTDQAGADQWYRNNSMWAYQYIDQSWPVLGKIFKCPADMTKADLPANLRNFYHSYTWSYDLLINWQDGQPRTPHTQYLRIWEVQRKILMLDGLCSGDGDPTYSAMANNLGTTGPLTFGNASMTVSSRHNGGSNCLYGDGSVIWMNKGDLVNTPNLWQ